MNSLKTLLDMICTEAAEGASEFSTPPRSLSTITYEDSVLTEKDRTYLQNSSSQSRHYQRPAQDQPTYR